METVKLNNLQSQFEQFSNNAKNLDKNKKLNLTSRLLKKKENNLNPKLVFNARVARVASDVVNVREKPYPNSPIVKKVYRGDILIIGSKMSKYGWYKTENGNYVCAFLLKILGK